MVDAWEEHVFSRICTLEKVGTFCGPDRTGLEHFDNKTLIWHDIVNQKFCKTALIDMVWSLEYGCNTSNEYAYIEETSLGFVGIEDKYNYAYRRNTALCIREHYFSNNSDLLKTAFLSHPFGTIIPHPFAQKPPNLNVQFSTIPLANISYMIVIDKDFDQVSENECINATQSLKVNFDNIQKEEIYDAVLLTANYASARSNPLRLKGIESCETRKNKYMLDSF